MAANKPKWKKYEEFVAALQKEFAPSAEVKHDDKIMGASGIERQVDVSIRTKISTFELLVVIDCKDWNKPVDIQDIEQFIGAVEDVKANKGAMMSSRGFTAAAKTRAMQKGIDLYSAIDVQSVDWPVFLAFPTFCDFRGPKRYNLKFSHTSPGPFAMPAMDAKYIPLYRKDGSYIDIVFNLLVKAWNEGRLPREAGEYKDLSFIAEDVYTKVDDVIYGPVKISSDMLVEKRLFFGSLPIIEGKGFRDEIKGSFHTRSITTDRLDVAEVENKWQRIEKVEDLAVKPVLELLAYDYLPMIQPSVSS